MSRNLCSDVCAESQLCRMRVDGRSVSRASEQACVSAVRRIRRCGLLPRAFCQWMRMAESALRDDASSNGAQHASRACSMRVRATQRAAQSGAASVHESARVRRRAHTGSMVHRGVQRQGWVCGRAAPRGAQCTAHGPPCHQPAKKERTCVLSIATTADPASVSSR